MSHVQLTELTKKNQEFIHIATNTLIKAGQSDEQVKALIAGILPTILENQKNGRTARALFGAPSEWAMKQIKTATEAEDDAKKPNTNPWLMWLDTSLMMTGIMSLVIGLLRLFGQGDPYGLLSLLIMGFGLGGGFIIMYRYSQAISQGARKRSSFWKAIGLLFLITLAWSIVIVAINLIPSIFNPIMNATATLLLAAIAFAARFFIKRKWNIQSALSTYPTEK